MRINAALACAIAAISATAAAPAAVHASQTLPAPRESMSLNGEWHYIVDQQDIGSKGYHDDPDGETDNRWFGRNLKPRRKSDLVEYDFAASPTLKVPGDWNTQKKELYYYEGIVWYQRDFEWKRPAGKGERAFIKFGAVSLVANVYVNGKKLGWHEGGFTPFEFEVTDVLKEGVNSVVVKADSTRRSCGIPTKGFDWWNYGGIIRDVEIETRPATYVKSWRVDCLSLSGEGEKRAAGLKANVKLDKAEEGAGVEISIPELGVSAKGVTDNAGEASIRIQVDGLAPWSPENPKLYNVVVKAASDIVSDEMGFRTIATKGKKILLNGEEVFLRGISLHDEAPDGGGRVTKDEEIAENIRRAKEVGANFVRLAHYPHNEKTVRACEKAGLMVWSEIPLYWMIDWRNPRTYASAEGQAKEMIRRDIRRANVVVWSLANETVPSKDRNDFLRRLAAFARSEDSTRLVSMAMEVTGSRNGVNRLHDELHDAVDIIAFNEYVGWYRNVSDADRMVWEIPFDKPVFISEFGGGALAGRHGAKDERWTEEMQANIYEANLRMLSKIDGLAGMSPWILTDFRSPRRVLAGVQDDYNRKGLFSPDGKKKLALGVMRRFYDSKRSAEIAR